MDKNPHVYTRDTLERASGENQFANGKIQAISVRSSLFGVPSSVVDPREVPCLRF